MGKVLFGLGAIVTGLNYAFNGRVVTTDKHRWWMVQMPDRYFMDEMGRAYYLDLLGHFFEPIKAVSDPYKWFRGKYAHRNML